MITLQFTTPWHLCSPVLYRYLPSKFADAFFSDGSLRLSSFKQFHQHADEQRLDRNEGRTMFVHQTSEGGGQSLRAWARHGHNAFVLCAATHYDREQMSLFGCDSYIRIDNPTAFGQAVARHIPGLNAGAEGLCLYQDKKIIERNLGFVNMANFIIPGTGNQVDKEKLEQFINNAMGHLPFFLKDNSFVNQCEYRLLWLVSTDVPLFLDLKVPEAIQFCSKPNTLTE
jgi:hypothetical protein